MTTGHRRAGYAAAIVVCLCFPREDLVDAGVASGFVVPLGSDIGWHILSYRGRPAHNVRFGTTGLTIEVAESAGPIVYRLPDSMHVGAIRARGWIHGGLNVPADRQGRTGFDDYTVRLGLVEVGTRRPSFFERHFAPGWLRTLFDLAPPGMGVSRLRFFNLGVSPDQVGQRRRHPMSDLVHEEIVGAPEPDGRFEITIDVEGVVEAAAIWIATDGDDTRSRFTVVLEHLEFERVAPDAEASQVPAATGRRCS